MTESVSPKRKKNKSSLAVLLVVASLCALVLVVAVGLGVAAKGVRSRTIIRVTLSESLPETPGGSPFQLLSGTPQLTLRGASEALRRAAKDERVAGVVIDVRDPQIGLAQIQELESAMAEVRAAGKWNVAFVETAGEFSRGTGAYALAVMADHITLAPPGEVNLLGLQADVPFLRGTLRKLDLQAHFEKRYAYKNAADTFTQDNFTPEHREAMQSLLGDLAKDITEHIAARRNKTPAEVQEWLNDAPFDAKRAQEAGVVDELCYWDCVDARAKEKAGRDDPFLDLQQYAHRVLDDGSGPTFALIVAEGAIHRGESTQGVTQSVGSDTIAEAFASARKEKVKGVLFRVSSPGGSYIASDVIRREVALTRQAGIPVVVSMGDMAASGGYFVAMQADHIVAMPSTITGSIGVYAGQFATRDFFNRWLGITFDSVRTHPSAGLYSGLDLPKGAHLAHINRALDRIYADFVTKAAEGRNKSYNEMHKVAQGRVWSGRRALELGLVDELGGFEIALRRLKEKAGVAAEQSVSLEVFPPPKTGLEQLLELGSASITAARELSQGVEAVRDAFGAGKERVLWSPMAIHL